MVRPTDYGTLDCDGESPEPSKVPVPILKRGESGRKRSISVEFEQQTESSSSKIVRRLTEEEKEDLYKERPDLKDLYHANVHTIMEKHARQQKRVFVVATMVLIVLVVGLTVYLIRFFLEHRSNESKTTHFRLGRRYKIT